MFTRLLPFRFQAGELFFVWVCSDMESELQQKGNTSGTFVVLCRLLLDFKYLYIYNLSVKQRKQKKII